MIRCLAVILAAFVPGFAPAHGAEPAFEDLGRPVLVPGLSIDVVTSESPEGVLCYGSRANLMRCTLDLR